MFTIGSGGSRNSGWIRKSRYFCNGMSIKCALGGGSLLELCIWEHKWYLESREWREINSGENGDRKDNKASMEPSSTPKFRSWTEKGLLGLGFFPFHSF